MSDQDQPQCPVDTQAREAWIRAAASQSDSTATPHPVPQTSSPRPSQTCSPLPGSCDSSTLEQPQRPAVAPFGRPKFTNTRARQLSQDRQVSSIPRFLPSATTDSLGQPHDRHIELQQQDASPNAQSENPLTSREGNWVYPSESQFHSALVRKHGAANAPPQDTIPSIIPIHNAVNERTWKEILDWERLSAPPAMSASANVKEDTKAAQASQAPQLVSFKGDSQKLTPRARFRGWIGYQPPFDRHDWVVRRRSGDEVEYVIDFYTGKGMNLSESVSGRMPLSFFLDVRPKLNSWEGWRMRFNRFWGLS